MARIGPSLYRTKLVMDFLIQMQDVSHLVNLAAKQSTSIIQEGQFSNSEVSALRSCDVSQFGILPLGFANAKHTRKNVGNV